MANEELKDKIFEWMQKKSTGEKKKYYLKDVETRFSSHYPRKEVQQAVNELVEADRLRWFSAGSSSLLTLPEFHKG